MPRSPAANVRESSAKRTLRAQPATLSGACCLHESLAESQSVTFADRRGDRQSRLPKGLHPCATMRRSHLHPLVSGRKQGPRTTLVQHGTMRQSGESGGASGMRAAGLRGRPASLNRIFRAATAPTTSVTNSRRFSWLNCMRAPQRVNSHGSISDYRGSEHWPAALRDLDAVYVGLGSKPEITAPQYCCPLLLSQQT